MFFVSMNQLLTAVFQIKIKMQRVALGEIAGKLAGLIIVILAVVLKLNVYFVLFSVVVGGLSRFLILFFSALRYVKISFQFDFDFWKKVLKRTWPLALSIIFSMLYFKMDTMILSWTRPQVDVGIYGASYKVLEILIIFPVMFIGLIFPLLSNSWLKKDREKFRRVFQGAFDFLVIIAIPLVIGGLFLGRKIMTFIAGGEFIISGDVLRILVFAIGFLFVGQLFGHIIIVLDKQKEMMWYYLMIAIISIIGYLIFIPKYSYYGAAGMTVLAELLMVIFSSRLIHKTTGVLPNLSKAKKALLASIVMAVPLYFLINYNLFLVLISGVVTYFSCLYLMKAISKETLIGIFNLKG